MKEKKSCQLQLLSLFQLKNKKQMPISEAY